MAQEVKLVDKVNIRDAVHRLVEIRRPGHLASAHINSLLPRAFLKDAPPPHRLQHVDRMVVTLSSYVPDSPNHFLRSVVAPGC